MKRAGLSAFILTASFAALLACSSGPTEFPAADFTLKSPLSGKRVSFTEYKGRPVLIYWFASW